MKMRALSMLLLAAYGMHFVGMVSPKQPSYYLMASFVKQHDQERILKKIRDNLKQHLNAMVGSAGLRWKGARNNHFHISYFGAIAPSGEITRVSEKRCGLVVDKAIEDFKCNGNSFTPCSVNPVLKLQDKNKAFVVLEFKLGSWLHGLQQKITQYAQDSCFKNKWSGATSLHISLGELCLLHPSGNKDNDAKSVQSAIQSIKSKINDAIATVSAINSSDLSNLSITFDSATVSFGQQYTKEYNF